MDGAEQYFETALQTGSENADDIKDETLETKENSDNNNAYSGVINGTDHDFHKLKNVVYKLELISDKLTLAAIDDQYEHFAKYLATLLRGIPNKKFLSLKQKFVNDVIQAKMALDESNTPSTLTGNFTVSQSANPIDGVNVNVRRDNFYQSRSSKRLQSKSNAFKTSGQDDVPVSKTSTNSEPLKVLVIPAPPNIMPPATRSRLLTNRDGNSMKNSSSSSLPARKQKGLLTLVPSKKLNKLPHRRPYIDNIHNQKKQKTSDEGLKSQGREENPVSDEAVTKPSQATEENGRSLIDDQFEMEVENESDNEGLSNNDDSDADPSWSPRRINEPTSPASSVPDIEASPSSPSDEQVTVADQATELLQLDNMSSSVCKPQSASTDVLELTVEELDGMPKEKLLQLLESRKETVEGTQENDTVVRDILKVLLGLDKPDEEGSADVNEEIMGLDSTEDLTQNVNDDENTSEENQEIDTNVRKSSCGTKKPKKVSADRGGGVRVLDSTEDNSEMIGKSGATNDGSKTRKSDSFDASLGDTTEDDCTIHDKSKEKKKD